MGTKIKMALSAAAVLILAFGVTGYAGALPRGAQDVAHKLIGAPAAGKHHGQGKQHRNAHANKAKHHATPVGPDAKGPAAYGLCNAYKHSHKHGKSLGHSMGMRNLARAAGGAGNISGYCAKVPRPSPEASEPAESESPEPEPSETD
jgi:hypothetical protein